MKYLLALFACLNAVALSAQSWADVSCGGEHTLAIADDGSLWGWGANLNGQVGDGTTDIRETPVQIGTDLDWWQVEAGGFHSLAIRNDSSLWGWGSNSVGQLAGGSANLTELTPVLIDDSRNWVRLDAGMGHTLGITSDGYLMAWGFNSLGQVGDGTKTNATSIQQIGTHTDWVDIAAGGFHSLAIRSTGDSLYGWGADANGQAGLGTGTDTTSPAALGNGYVDVSAGFEFSLAINTLGNLVSWGFQGNGQLGNGNGSGQVNSPTIISSNIDWISVEAGSAYAFAMSQSNGLHAWGANLFGELGLGHAVQQDVPTAVAGSNWTTISAAVGITDGTNVLGFHSAGLRSGENNICVTGVNYAGQLGVGGTLNQDQFTCSVSTVSSTGKIKGGHALLPYPNPASTTLRFDQGLTTAKFQGIYDISGRAVSRAYWLPSGALDVTGLSPGIYFARFDSNGVQHSLRFVKQ